MPLALSTFRLSLALGLLAGLANILGGVLLVQRSPSARSLRYFVALGSGFMLSAALLEMVPESLHLDPSFGPVLLLAGYCGVHLLEHTVVPHFHFGEETHHHEFVSAKTSYSVLLGLATHTFFDGIAIGSAFVLSRSLGWLIFLAIFLHKLPEGFTVASVMLAGGRSRRTALYAALLLAAGVTLYVAATDLVPEVNREPGIRMAFVFFAGVALFLLLRSLTPV